MLSRKSRIIRLILFITIVTVTMLILVALRTIFSIKHITVDGIHDIRGIESYFNKNIFFVSTHQAQTDLIAINPSIATIIVYKKFPDTLVVHVTKSRPVVTLKLSDGALAVSSKGVIVKKNKQPFDEELPVINYYQPLYFNQFAIGETLEKKDISAVTQFTALMLDIGVKTSAIDIPSENMIVLHTDDFDIFITSEKDIDKQFQDFQYTYKQLKIEGKKYSSIDVRFDKPILKIL